jgi:hypothetical protein
LEHFQPKTFMEGDNIVAALLDANFTVKATGIQVKSVDEVHIWHFDADGMIVKFGHRVDTHQQWQACGLDQNQ